MRTGLLLFAVLLMPGLQLTAQETDPDTGLLIAEGWESVRVNCTECHSALLITSNSGSRAVWQSRIIWMQETQGLQQLSPEVEDTILAYLADHYGRKEASRRAALPREQLPANPYPVDSPVDLPVNLPVAPQ